MVDISSVWKSDMEEKIQNLPLQLDIYDMAPLLRTTVERVRELRKAGRIPAGFKIYGHLQWKRDATIAPWIRDGSQQVVAEEEERRWKEIDAKAAEVARAKRAKKKKGKPMKKKEHELLCDYMPISDELIGMPALLCPVCKEGYVHPIDVVHLSGISKDGVVIIADGKLTYNPSVENPERGEIIRLRFWGECGHEFSYQFQFHKGLTVLSRETAIPPDRISGLSIRTAWGKSIPIM